MRRIRYDRLPTERANPGTGKLDRLSAARNRAAHESRRRRAVRAVGRAAPALGRAVDLIVRALSRRGRLIFVGAGTSGRLGALEAAERPPTFDTPPSLVQAVIAGGKRTVFAPPRGGGGTDRRRAADPEARTARGMVVGIAASGVTPFVRGVEGGAQARRCPPRWSPATRDVPSRPAS